MHAIISASSIRIYMHAIITAIMYPYAYTYHQYRHYASVCIFVKTPSPTCIHGYTHVTTIAMMYQCAYASSSSASYIHVRTHDITIDIMCSVEDNKHMICLLNSSPSVYFIY
ncbi:hypothetical protein CEXT_535751 [Caerostris extrusa]|uniref:Uncharacterized protein n=1 Tax=Caerostris extrusa TaxID=172846 RepID=A0AAV4W1S0_CAEEX|nr:hypothetical protein CEXT_535751 [Caerostris extrusa]